jgi:hypothetical protein
MLDQLRRARVVPVVTIREAADAVPLAEALAAGGLPVIEITLRTAAGLDAIRMAVGVQGAIVGAGTVTTGEQAEPSAAAITPSHAPWAASLTLRTPRALGAEIGVPPCTAPGRHGRGPRAGTAAPPPTRPRCSRRRRKASGR